MSTQKQTADSTVKATTKKATAPKKAATVKATSDKKAAAPKEPVKKATAAATKTKQPVSKAERARQIHLKQPELTVQGIVRAMEKEGIKVYFSQVQAAIAAKATEEATA